MLQKRTCQTLLTGPSLAKIRPCTCKPSVSSSSDSQPSIQSYQKSSFLRDDIDGSRTCLHPYSYTNKECYINRNDDIQKSRGKKLTKERRQYPDKQLMTSDIEKAQSNLLGFKTTRFTNPLSPVYQLPYAEKIQPYVPPFVRDSFDVSDITGTKPKIKIRKRLNVIEPQIEVPKKLNLQRSNDALNIADINSQEIFSSKRQTHPLQPQYCMPGDKGQVKYPIIDRSKPKVLHPTAGKQPCDLILKTEDIYGASATTSFRHAKPQFNPQNEKSSFLNTETNYLSQGHWKYQQNSTFKPTVLGSSTNTVHRGIVTKRQISPLNPKYQFLGHSQSAGRLATFDSYITKAN